MSAITSPAPLEPICADAGLRFVRESGSDGKRSVAVFEPTYALHSHIARITGTEVAIGERTEDHALDLDEVRRCTGNPYIRGLAQDRLYVGSRKGPNPR